MDVFGFSLDAPFNETAHAFPSPLDVIEDWYLSAIIFRNFREKQKIAPVHHEALHTLIMEAESEYGASKMLGEAPVHSASGVKNQSTKKGRIMKRKPCVTAVAAIALLGLFGCNTMPEKPDFKPSSNFDGNYRGVRADVSNDPICKETAIVGSVTNGEASLKLTYNDTNLNGWIDEKGALKLYDDNNRWNYHFSGIASGSTIEGEWSVDGAPCKGTWRVERQ